MAEEVDNIRYFDPNLENNVPVNPEDLTMFVDLRVDIPSRYHNNEGNIAINGIDSIMGGEDITINGKTTSYNLLTDSFVNVSYTEIDRTKGCVKNGELFGINSIDISFSANLFPVVTINFTDIRGMALMNPYEYRNGEATELASSFFESIFKFPYPKFILKVKGYYGTPVSFNLCVSDFNAEFNSETGNYDIIIKFVGDLYGCLVDIPMSYVLYAPYYNRGYWDEQVKNGIFTFDDGYAIPKYSDFIVKQNDGVNEGFDIIGANIEEYSKLKKQLRELEEAIYRYSKLEETLLNKCVFSSTPPISGLIFLINENSERNKLKEIEKEIENFKKYIETTNYHNLFKQCCYLNDTYLENNDNRYYTWNRVYNEDYEETKRLDSSYNDLYLRLLQKKVNDQKLLELIDELNKKIQEIETKAVNEINYNFSNYYGLLPSIKNVYKTLFSYLETFIEVLSRSKGKYSVNENYGLYEKINKYSKHYITDFKKETSIIPSYPLFAKKTNDGYEKIYPGEILELKEMNEVKFVDNIFNTLVKEAKYEETSWKISNPSGVKFFPILIDDYFKENPYMFLFKGISDNDFVNVSINIFKILLMRLISASKLSRFKKEEIIKLEIANIYEALKSLPLDIRQKISGIEFSDEIFKNGKITIDTEDYFLYGNKKILNDSGELNAWYSEDIVEYKKDSETFPRFVLGNYRILPNKLTPSNFFMQNKIEEDIKEVNLKNFSYDSSFSIESKINGDEHQMDDYADLASFRKIIWGESGATSEDSMIVDFGKETNISFFDNENKNTNLNYEIIFWFSYNAELQIDFLKTFLADTKIDKNKKIATLLLLAENKSFFNEIYGKKEKDKYQNILKDSANTMFQGIASNYDFNKEEFKKSCDVIGKINELSILKLGAISYGSKDGYVSSYAPVNELLSPNKPEVRVLVSHLDKEYLDAYGLDTMEKFTIIYNFFNEWVDNNGDLFLKELSEEFSKGYKSFSKGNVNNKNRDGYAAMYYFTTSTLKKINEKVYYIKKYANKKGTEGKVNITDIYESLNEIVKKFTAYKEWGNKIADSREEYEKEENNNLIKRSIYYTLKNINDKWDVENLKKRYKLNSGEFSKIDYIDSFGNDLSDKLIFNIEKLNKLLEGATNDVNPMSFYETISKVAEDNRGMFLTIPEYNNKNIEDMFKTQTRASLMDNKMRHIFMYPGEACDKIDGGEFLSNKLIIHENGYTTEDAKILFNGSIINAFGVTYGNLNQNYFKNIKINMETPGVTDYSIANTLMLSSKNEEGKDRFNRSLTNNNLWNIYSNRAYTCSIDMLGCVNITPMTYFQLNNIPMFNGAYVITNVSHKIIPGEFTTSFEGVRVSKYKPSYNRTVFYVEDILNKIDEGKIKVVGIDIFDNNTNNQILDITIDTSNLRNIILDDSIKSKVINAISGKTKYENYVIFNKIEAGNAYGGDRVSGYTESNEIVKQFIEHITTKVMPNYFNDYLLSVNSLRRNEDKCTPTSQHRTGYAIDLQILNKNGDFELEETKKLFSIIATNYMEYIYQLIWENDEYSNFRVIHIGFNEEGRDTHQIKEMNNYGQDLVRESSNAYFNNTIKMAKEKYGENFLA